MYNNVYQEYINNMLGTNPNYNRMEPMNFENTINNNYFENSMNNNQFFQNSINTENTEQLYPDLYRLLYPMIQNACMKNTNPITEETINNMVEEVYSNFMVDDQMFEEVDSDNQFRSGKNLVTTASKTKSVSSATVKKEERALKEDREFRQNNHVMRDLIRILILRELIGNHGNKPSNWQMSSFSPTFRPPFNTQEFSNNNAMYEASFY